MYKKIVIFAVIILGWHTTFSQNDYPKARTFPKADSLLFCLASYHSGTIKPIYPLLFSPKRNVNDAVKAKLLSLIERRWTRGELNLKLQAYLIRNPFKRDFEWRFWNAGIHDSITDWSTRIGGNGFDSIYHSVYDSLEVLYKQAFEKSLIEAIVPDELVLSAAAAQVKQAIPILKKDLIDSVHYFNAETAEMALAVLDDKEFKQKYLQWHRSVVSKETWTLDDINKDASILMLMNTQESLSMLADWLDISKTYKQYSEDDDPKMPNVLFSSHVVPILLTIIQNKDLKEGVLRQPWRTDIPGLSSSFYFNTAISKEQVQFIKQWMIANKGKYEIN